MFYQQFLVSVTHCYTLNLQRIAKLWIFPSIKYFLNLTSVRFSINRRFVPFSRCYFENRTLSDTLQPTHEKAVTQLSQDIKVTTLDVFFVFFFFDVLGSFYLKQVLNYKLIVAFQNYMDFHLTYQNELITHQQRIIQHRTKVKSVLHSL